MIFLKNDYSIGAHPDVLKMLVDHNMELNDTYGDDAHSARVTEMVRELTGQPEVDVHFILGGGLTNRTCMAAFLRPYEAVITTTDGHIAVHEAGSVEATGHRLLEVPTPDDKMLPEQIDEIAAYHNMDQMVIPKLVYISNTTELGTIYTKEEMLAIREACDRHNMYLYMDGARLGTLLGAEKNDLTWKDIAEITDAFYAGG
ncbi:MAG: threonine aldolase, partial [Firmicutes bacterium]|nr:threonine aldolase [Bacillota bacterium]